MKYLLLLLLFATPAFAADDDARKLRAIEPLVVQRNSAMDGLAICNGDLSALQKENTELKAEIDRLKKLLPNEGPKR